MSEAFVWFHNGSENPSKTASFYEKLLGWKGSPGPAGLTLLVGAKGPLAGVAARGDDPAAWLPYVQVDDVDAATKRALGLGAVLVKEKARGPAGDFTVIRDPGGATLALWKQA